MSRALPKKSILRRRGAIVFFPILILLLAGLGCRKLVQHFLLDGYEQTNLVSDVPGYGAVFIDPSLVNPWGIAVAPSGPIWVSDNGTGLSTIYNKSGATLRPPVSIPTPDSSGGGAPTGIVFNGTTDFSFLANKKKVASRFIFATEDGTLAAWGEGNFATIVANRSPWNAVYKGLALANDGGANFLYATNFHGGTIDVFDKNFTFVTGKAFHDPSIPSDFGPFNIRNIEGWLYVTYAKRIPPENRDDLAGPGNGFVDIFKPDGSFVKRFASQGALNSPWGIVQSTQEFCKKGVTTVLIGNFGDGRINMFSEQGKFLGPLQDDKHIVFIEGLWALENKVPGTDPTQLYFTAGILKEKHGLFGYLKRESE
jgi:uncharacterized protein (TIGR03118 family)